MVLLNRLEQNCHTLYHVQTSSQHTLPLVANYAGTHIYDSRYFWGRLWIYFYSIAQWFNPQLRFDKLKQAIIHTDALFHKTLAVSLIALQHYQNYLIKAAEGQLLDEALYMPHRKQLNAWNAAYLPFSKKLQHCTDVRIQKLFAECFDRNKAFENPDLPKLRDIHYLLALEGILRGPLPLASFKKVLDDQPLTALEEKKCTKWINKLNKSSLQPYQLQKATQILIARLAPAQPQEILSTKLLLWLEKNDCQLFYKPSHKHLRWSNQLTSGVAIDKTKALIIEREINPSFSGYKNRVFSLIGKQDSVAIVAQNKIRLYLRYHAVCTQMPPELGLATFEGVFQNGKYALMEKLYSLESYAWSNQDSYSEIEEQLLIKISSLLKHFLTANYSLIGFSSDNVLLDKAHCLKLSTLLPKGEFDFNALERFIAKVSTNHSDIYIRLMRDSGMHEHPIAKFYLDLITQHTSGHHPITSEDLAAIYKISDPRVVDRGRILICEIKELQNQLYQHLQNTHPQRPFKQLESEISGTLLAIYSSSGHASLLPQNLFNKIIVRLS